MSGADAILLQTGGLVLAGGASRRFGSEKALATFRGETLLDIALDRFTRCDRQAVNAAPDSGATAHAERLGLVVVSDDPTDPLGPLSGVKAGLNWTNAAGLSFLAIAPCDAPLLPDDLYLRLAESIGDAPAAYAVTADGDHPLCALWRSALYAPLSSVLRTGSHPPVHAFLETHGATPVMFNDARAFANANSVNELKRLE